MYILIIILANTGEKVFKRSNIRFWSDCMVKCVYVYGVYYETI